ncbi:MAG: GerMN domain-containing protein, partial [Syntrophomonadaceae bacterium]|nr:GerMN domain-containing protein [Syntrophomonadaceae bacterium]
CEKNKAENNPNKPPLTPTQQKETVNEEITLYFGDDQAEYLIPEQRIVQVEKNASDEKLVKVIIDELIAGPKDQSLRPTIPPEPRLLSVEINNKIATLNFKEEIRTKHWGGSAGETMTITSIVNTVTELNSIEKVQILIEGEVQDSLIGHWYIGEPIERSEEIIKR